VRLRHAAKEVRIVIDGSDPFAPSPKPDPSLIKAIIKLTGLMTSWCMVASPGLPIWQKTRSCTVPTTAKFSVSPLAPDITNAILEGRQPPGLTISVAATRNRGDRAPGAVLDPPGSAGASMPDRDIPVIWRTLPSAQRSLPTASTQHTPQNPGNSGVF
jgi:hypothetical protein